MERVLTTEVRRALAAFIAVTVGAMALVGLVEVGVAVIVAAVVSVALGAAAASLLTSRRGHRRSGIAVASRVARHGLLAVGVVLALAGSSSLFGRPGPLVATAALLAWWRLAARPRPPAHPARGEVLRVLDRGANRPVPEDVETAVRALDGPSLGRVWRACRPEGRVTGVPVRVQAELAGIREIVLDELERRDPDAFASWLARGATDDPPVPFDELS
jgi:hypothetical protein